MERKNHMRKNSKNEKVIRAMAIGISAMLMASSPLTALAAEGEGTTPEGNEDKNITVTPEAGIADQAQVAAKEAATEAKKAEDKAYEVKAEVQEGTKDAKTEVGEQLAGDIWDANANIEAATSKDGASIDNAKTDIANADTALDVAEAKDKLSDAELNKAADAAANAGQTAAEAKDAMQASQDKVNGQIENIKDAASITDANAAYEEVKTTVDQAQADFDAKLGEYNTAKTAYEEAAQKVADYEEAYEAAISSADADAVAAAAELATAKANAEALAKALEAAKAAVDKSAAGALDIAKQENTTQTDNGLNWKNEDQLFISIMQNYYLPEKCGIKGTTEVKRIQGEDNDTKNYFEVTYTDEKGNTQTKYYNYVMDDKQTSKDNIVIFEKRIEEVNWKTAQETNPDQYVKENGDIISVSDVKKGLEEGTIIAVDGKKVIKNGGTESSISDNNQKTETGEVDTVVNEATEKESWKLDENGKLIKTVTADVTTITYTNAKFTSTEQYQTEADRNAAAAAKKEELENANNGKEATVTGTEKTDYTYTGNGTYIPTFTKTVDVKKTVRSWDSASEVQNDVKDDKINDIKDQIKKETDCDELYLISESSTLTTNKTEDNVLLKDKYEVSGTVSATYAKVTKKTVDQSTLGAIWDDIKSLFGKGETANKKLENAARVAVEADGGIFVSANWDDWKLGKATIRYVAGVTASTEEKTKAEDAESALQDAMLAEAKKSGATGIYNVNTNTKEIERTSYSYTIDYLKQNPKSTENQVIATETYANAEVLTGQIIQNLNYIQGNIKLTQKDDDYRKFVDNAKALTEKYQKLLKDAQKAQEAVEVAEGKVADLKTAIKDLKSNRTSNLGALEELEGKLAAAEQNKKDAEDTLKEILGSLDEAGGELDKVIERLTPAPTPGTPAGGEGETGGAGDTEEGGAGEAATVVTPVALAAAPAAQATVVAQNQAAAPVVQIADEAAPLAEAAPANTQETVQAGSDKEETKEAVNIEEEAVPLADVAVESEHAKMSWWWWLIILILGATGYEMYKKHNEKKLKAQAENAGDIEE